MPRIKKEPGFTLIELLIALVVASLLLAWGVPNFQRFMNRTTLTSETNNWLGVINSARNEAVTRGERVTVCRTLTPDACDGTNANCNCGTSPNNEYHTGYLMFTSAGNSQPIDFDAASNELILTGRIQSDKVRIRGNCRSGNAFSFMSDGRLDPLDVGNCGGTPTTARQVICIMEVAGDESTAINSPATPGRAVVVASTGRPRVVELPPDADCSSSAANALAE